jgi:hypothetical protein
MTKSLLSLLALGLLAPSCGGSTYNYVGYRMDKQFPLDGDREWQYLNDNEGVEHPIRVEKLSTPRMVDTIAVYTLEYYNEETGDIVRSVDWSSDSINGVLIHAYTHYEAGEDPVEFDPPIQFADDEMAPGASVVTETGGYTFTSTLEGSEPCPNHYVPDWDECLRMTLDDGDGDDSAGALVAGEYWLVPSFGTAWFRMTPDSDNWRLWKHSWDPE